MQAEVEKEKPEEAKENKPDIESHNKQIVEKIKTGMESLRTMHSKAGGFPMMGKKLDEWEAYFKIDLDGTPTTANMYIQLGKINGFTSLVNKNAMLADIAYKSIEAKVKSYKAKRFAQLKKSGTGRAPSNDYVNSLIEKELEDEMIQLSFSHLILEYWQDKQRQLISTRKVIEAILYSLASEMRMNRGVTPFEDS